MSRSRNEILSRLDQLYDLLFEGIGGPISTDQRHEHEAEIVELEHELRSYSIEYELHPEDRYEEEYEDNYSDVEADADTLRSCGWGTDEDYGYFGGDEW